MNKALSAVDGALMVYDMGGRVFPVSPGKKTPAFEGWQAWAESATRSQIEEFGRKHPFHNWGLFCGASNLTVIDLDNKSGISGVESIKALMKEVGKLPNTFATETPSKGMHLYYKGAHGTTAGKLGPGIDTRGKGGYVLTPGSKVDQKPYTPLNDYPIAELPPPFAKLIDEGRNEKHVLGQKEELCRMRNDTFASLAGTMRSRGMGFNAIYAALVEVNRNQLETPLEDESEIETIARSICRYEPDQALAAADFIKKPEKLLGLSAADIAPASVAARDWIGQGRYIGKFINLMIAPGGVGKSNMAILDAISLVTGQNLSGFEVIRPAGVWLYNTEDPLDELKRRVVAAAMHHKIKLSDLSRLFITSGREAPLVVAKHGRNGISINEAAISEMVQFIIDNDIRVLMVDPFVRTHEVNENDNMHIDRVIWAFQQVADRTGAAVSLVHHSRKPGANAGARGDGNTARGASSLLNASRIANTLTPMDEKEADRFGVAEEKRPWFVRLDNAKANLAPPASEALWFEKISITLMNGDSVGVLARADLVDKTLELKEKEIEIEAVDIAKILSSEMEIGRAITLNDAFKILQKEVHIFDCSKKWGQKKMTEALGSGKCEFQNKKFSYVFMADEYRKHWVECTETKDFLT